MQSVQNSERIVRNTTRNVGGDWRRGHIKYKNSQRENTRPHNDLHHTSDNSDQPIITTYTVGLGIHNVISSLTKKMGQTMTHKEQPYISK